MALTTTLFPILPNAAWDPRWDAPTRGLWGERAVARHLWRNGYRLLEHRWQSPSGSDIDLVAATDELLVFVEVKLRGPADAEPWAEVHAPERVARLREAIGAYLRATRQQTVTLRCDAWLVTPDPARPRHPVLQSQEDYILPTAIPSWRGIPPEPAPGNP